MTRPIFRWVAPLLAVFIIAPLQAAAQQPTTEYEGAAALGLDLRRLGVTKRVLMIGAHPDDENTQILSTLALGQGADVAYLALTRGEGGQNGIGPELEEGLGLLRTEELLAARRLDGARQFFTRAYDYGFSRNAEEAFQHWPREELLADVVAVIRYFRPDVILSVFSGTPRDGHGQHQAAGIMAREAFVAAGDPSRFPDQIAAGLAPFAPTSLYMALWGDNGEADLRLETGEVDPLLGSSYFQVAMASRSRHRSQDMGRPLTPGPQASGLALAAGDKAGSAPGASLFAGVDTALSLRLGGRSRGEEASPPDAVAALLKDFESRVDLIRQSFNPLEPGRMVRPLAEALGVLRRAIGQMPRGEVRVLAEAEAGETEAALWRAAALELDATAADEVVVPGQELELVLTLWNGGGETVRVRRLEPLLPEGWTAVAAESLPAELAPGELLERAYKVRVAADADPTRPYFLRREREGDMYAWEDGRHAGLPFDPPPVRAIAEVELAGGEVGAQLEAAFLGLDRRQGEFRRPIRIVPAVSVRVAPASAVAPIGRDGGAAQRLPIRATIRSEAPAGIAGRLVIDAPDGWRAEPQSVDLEFTDPGQERAVDFVLSPPSALAPGKHRVAATFVTADGSVYDEGFTLVDYPHVRPHPIYREAAASVRSFPISVPEGLEVGYIPGAGDDAPEALRQLGISVTVLGPEELATGDLSRFDALLTGIRAYEVNPDLVARNRRVLDYVRRGGTLVVQYSKYEYTEPGIAPYPVEMARPHGRVTDENAEVRLLEPEHQALRWPNRITADDFSGWQQERGLYFLSEWDEQFTPLLEMADPGEPAERGSLLVAPLGEGTYVYTGIAFFRQFPEGVPGAHRLLVNLLSLGVDP